MTKLPVRLVPVIIYLIGMAACRNVVNYVDPSGPRYAGDYAVESADFDGVLKVVSYNIEHSQDIAGALQELENLQDLIGTDIALLQEMDEAGADSIAREAGFNFVYYPANIHSSSDRNFGNAILSRFPIIDDGKIILPHEDIKREQKRIAVYATIDVEGILVRAYSVHTENLWMSPGKRFSQADSLLKSIPDSIAHALVGGDFNTADPITLAATPRLFRLNDFDWATQGVGSTVKMGPVGVISDFIFSRGFGVIQAGKIPEASASDHLPVWVDLKFILPE